MLFYNDIKNSDVWRKGITEIGIGEAKKLLLDRFKTRISQTAGEHKNLEAKLKNNLQLIDAKLLETERYA